MPEDSRKNGVADRLVAILAIVGLLAVWVMRDSESYQKDLDQTNHRLEVLESNSVDQEQLQALRTEMELRDKLLEQKFGGTK